MKIAPTLSVPTKYTFDMPDQTSLDDRIARSQLISALKNSIRSTLAANKLIDDQLRNLERQTTTDPENHGLSNETITLLQAKTFLSQNITNIKVLMTACGVEVDDT